ncbi:hypothetical protein [Novosphingobium sp. P6W]|uniref:hypothetical protein n=1 Tax=Novosphingobium sp. P6W TaxID=1609758 RepID=UPI0005C2DD7E|nr:hypothetical protein [Novosphingobium sp. P6W]AXB77516.1 hypothetical protein TQ38_014220 [Novosphingobium sp. P6W]KIS33883.1 hypothetical protein TQ38_04145 [Novosphingobium sp. P6W]
MSSGGFPWSLLGIAATSDTKAIRGAYAGRIKAMDLDRNVEGYAQLRGARDTALRLAKTMPQPGAGPDDPQFVPEAAVPQAAEPQADLPEPPAPPPAPPEPLASPQWPHAAPTLAGEWQADPALSARPAQPQGDHLLGRVSPEPAASTENAGGEAAAPGGADPFAVPLLEGFENAAAVGQQSQQSPFARLAAMLDTEAPAGLSPMDEGDEARARMLLEEVLETVHHSDIGRQGEMEDWLAGLLADAWPRSAPLLEDAVAAFDWEREWGKIDARPAIDYLGARLRGHRFERKVQQKGHRYHKAWTELGRPEKAGPLRHLRANGADVRGLLTGIRKHFPELEERLDARRIASWEGGNSWLTGTIVLGGLIILGFLVSLGDSGSSGPDARAQALAATVADVFGLPHDPDWLRQHESELTDKLAESAQFTPDGKADLTASMKRGLDIVRGRTYLVGRHLEGDDFETTMRLRLALLKTAQADGTAACQMMMTFASTPPTTLVPLEVRGAERTFYASLATRGLLKEPEKLEGSSASVPGALVAKVIAATKLSKQEVGLAMQGKSSDAHRCAATVALLEATLDWKGEGRRAILQTL